MSEWVWSFMWCTTVSAWNFQVFEFLSFSFSFLVAFAGSFSDLAVHWPLSTLCSCLYCCCSTKENFNKIVFSVKFCLCWILIQKKKTKGVVSLLNSTLLYSINASLRSLLRGYNLWIQTVTEMWTTREHERVDRASSGIS